MQYKNYKLISTNKLEISNLIKKKIFLLKKTYWKYNIKDQRNFFEKHTQNNDIIFYIKLNNLLNNVIAHFMLKLKYYYLNNQKKKFLLIDSVIVSKKYRNKGIGKSILKKCKKISQKKKLPLIAISIKKNENFYLNADFKLLKKENLVIKNLKKNKLFFSYNFNFKTKPTLVF